MVHCGKLTGNETWTFFEDLFPIPRDPNTSSGVVFQVGFGGPLIFSRGDWIPRVWKMAIFQPIMLVYWSDTNGWTEKKHDELENRN